MNDMMMTAKPEMMPIAADMQIITSIAITSSAEYSFQL